MTESETKRLSLDSLPPFVLLKILKELDVETVLSVSSCCQFLKQIAKLELLWETIYMRRFEVSRLCSQCDGNRQRAKNNPNKIHSYRDECLRYYIRNNFWLGFSNQLVKAEKFVGLGPVHKICLLDKRCIVLTGIINKLYLYSFQMNRYIKAFSTDNFQPTLCLVVVKNGIVLSNIDGTVELWEPCYKQGNYTFLKQLLYRHQRRVSCAFAHGNILITGSEDATATIYNLKKHYLIRTIQYLGVVKCCSASHYVLVVAGYNGTALLIDRNTFKDIGVFHYHSATIVHATLHNDIMVTISRDDTIKIWNLSEKEIKYEIKTCLGLKFCYEDAKFLSDHMMLVNNEMGGIQLLCLQSYQSIHTFTHEKYSLLDFILLDYFMIVSTSGRTVEVYDLISMRNVQCILDLSSTFPRCTNLKMFLHKNRLVVAANHKGVWTKNNLYFLDLGEYFRTPKSGK